MMLIVVIAAASLAPSLVSRLIVGAVASTLGLVIATRARNVERAIVAFAHAGVSPRLDFDLKPTHAQRRAMRSGLALAIRQTELTSLLPFISLRAQRLVRTGG